MAPSYSVGIMDFSMRHLSWYACKITENTQETSHNNHTKQNETETAGKQGDSKHVNVTKAHNSDEQTSKTLNSQQVNTHENTHNTQEMALPPFMVNTIQAIDCSMSKIAAYFETNNDHCKTCNTEPDITIQKLDECAKNLDKAVEKLDKLINITLNNNIQQINKHNEEIKVLGQSKDIQKDTLQCLKSIETKSPSNSDTKDSKVDQTQDDQNITDKLKELEIRIAAIEAGNSNTIKQPTKDNLPPVQNAIHNVLGEKVPKTLYSDKVKSTQKDNIKNNPKGQSSQQSQAPPKVKNVVKFRGKDNPLSNLYMGKNKLKVNGKWYNSSEQAYQERKCEEHNAQSLKQRIQNSTDTFHIMRCGQKVTTTIAWKRTKRGVMKEILESKYIYDETFRKALIETDDSDIIEDTYHPFWGGRNGQNVHGKILMEIRDNPPELCKVETVINDKPNNNNVLCIVDSNGSRIHFNKILPGYHVKVKRAHTIEQANDIISTHTGPEPDKIFIHTGTNDLIENNNTADNFIELTSTINKKWPNVKLVVSKVLPRGGKNMYKKVKTFNNSVENALIFEDHVDIIDHSDMLWGDNPNTQFYEQESKNGRNLPLLHLNPEGLSVLANKIRHSFKRLRN